LLDAQEVSDGNIDERSLVLYISLYFHAFIAKQQQMQLLREREDAEGKLKGLQGTLEERAKMASELQDENSKLKEELESIKRQLSAEKEARAELQEKEHQKTIELQETKATLQAQVVTLQEQVADLSTKFTTESTSRQKENEDYSKQSKAELKGLEVLKQNLEAHVEDLNRWMKYLDLDTQSEVDFTGEIRPQIMLDISKQNFDDQLDYLSKKLGKENDEILAFLKQKETEAKAKKANQDKKKKKEKKSDE